MTKSADQEHASPSSSFPAYVFVGPAMAYALEKYASRTAKMRSAITASANNDYNQ
ncbi:hypothetical protein [Halopseudomonas pelagia]|uniref:hypothetical protein n=1 Tax=Halopseudomonas pelagia TaxID=553151 RepID=UPI001293116D|nr:hypothetical protein [Halopseudomonas pelagia]